MSSGARYEAPSAAEDPRGPSTGSEPCGPLPWVARRPRPWWSLGARSLGVLVLAYALLFNVSVVRGSSMSPGIRDGDRILVEPWSYLVHGAERGDIVVLRYPLDPRLDYIKRVVGLPGDEIVIAGGHLWVNGGLLREEYAVVPERETYLATRVEPDHVFVLGDNRPRSSDSREFGQVPLSFLRGRVEVRVWPPTRAGVLE